MASLGNCLHSRRASVFACALVALSAAGLAPGLHGPARAANSALSAASTTLVGDVDGDCSVSVLDLSLIAARYGYSFGSLRYAPLYDINHDGTIDIFDIQRAAAHFGEHC